MLKHEILDTVATHLRSCDDIAEVQIVKKDEDAAGTSYLLAEFRPLDGELGMMALFDPDCEQPDGVDSDDERSARIAVIVPHLRDCGVLATIGPSAWADGARGGTVCAYRGDLAWSDVITLSEGDDPTSIARFVEAALHHGAEAIARSVARHFDSALGVMIAFFGEHMVGDQLRTAAKRINPPGRRNRGRCSNSNDEVMV